MFLDVYLQGGFEFVTGYLEEHFRNQEEMLALFAAVVLNRMHSVFTSKDMHCLVYDVSWYPFIAECLDDSTEDGVSEDGLEVDISAHRLFTEIVTPLFGRCDSHQKAEHIGDLADKQKDAIIALKKVCQEIVETSMFYRNKEMDMRDKMFKKMMAEKMIEPLSCLMLKSRNDVKKVLADFALDSTVIAGILGATQGMEASTVGLSLAAGFISAGLSYILREENQKKNLPGKFLLDELKRNRLSYLAYESNLQRIRFDQIRI